MIRFLTVCILLLSVYSVANSSFAIETTPPIDKYRISGGISFKQLDFDVYDKGSLNTNGTLTEGMDTTLFLHAGSPYRYFTEKTSWGYYLEYGVSLFEMKHQEVGSKNRDLNTSVEGGYGYLTPVLVYNFGKSYNLKYSIILGVGAGIGFIEASGDIIFTEKDSNRKEAIDISDFGLTATVIVDIQIKNFLIRLRGAGPTVEQNNYEYDIFEFSIDIGYTFFL